MTILLSMLGVYAVTLVLTSYSGPFDLFSRMRSAAPESLQELVYCFVCMSFWVSLAFSILLGLSVLEYLAVVGGAILLYKATER